MLYQASHLMAQDTLIRDMKDLEQIVGLQTDKPLKRAFMPYGGIKMAEEALQIYGYTPNENFHKIFTEYHKTHNQAVFDAYTPEMLAARHTHIVTGLPDTYGRGRIVGDYRRVALYGIDSLSLGRKRIRLTVAMATCLMMSSVREKSFQSRLSSQRDEGYGCSHTDMIFQSQLQTLKRLFSGYTSDTLQLSRLRTVQLCQLDVYLHSLISTLREILRLVSLQRLRLRSLSIISQ